MTYIYDLIINLNEEDYKFYEWRETDKLKYLKKCILVKVSNYMYEKFITNNIILDNSFLEIIKNKSILIDNKKEKPIPFMIIITNSNDVIGLVFNENGRIIKRTRVSVQDELEILEISKKLKCKKISYKSITNNKHNITFFSREEKDKINYILNKLNEVKNNKDELNYLYYEWFNKTCEDDKPYEKLVNDIKINYEDNKESFINLLNIVTSTNV